MKKLLCIVGGMNSGGAETFLMKIFRKIDKEQIQMDFCVGVKEKGFYDDEITNGGGKIYHISKKSKNPFKSFLDIVRIVRKGHYDNVIRISQHSLSSIDLLAAKIGGAKKLLFRSSNSNSCGSFINRLIHIICKPLAIIIPNVKIAPSDVAAIHMFGKNQYKNNKVVILKNGLSISDYKFNNDMRIQKRKELGLSTDDFVIGHIGRMTKQKNHLFLVDLLEKVLENNKNARLILIGDGELRNEIINYINSKMLSKYVYILGLRADSNELYQAMDCFVFPSLYEGMPNTVIEAQTSGLKCVISDAITKAVDITENVVFCSLKDKEQWIKNIDSSKDRENKYKKVCESGYDISDVVNIFVSYLF